jgi:signal transduction histidine kinase/CheY-like chemotaxis protein
VNESPRVLLLEDELLDAELIAAALAADDLRPAIQRVDTLDDSEAALADGEIDLILADYQLPRFGGLAALRLAQACAPDVPFIFVSGALGDERAVELLTSGATDYVLKGHLNRLAPAVRRALREAAARAEARCAQREIERAAHAQRVLAEAGRVLASSLDFRAQLRGVAQIAVPLLADGCAVDVVAEDGALVRLALVAAEPVGDALRRLADAVCPARVLRDGQVRLLPDVPAIGAGAPDRPPAPADGLCSLGLRSAIIAPLVARAEPLGLITFVTAASGRRYTTAEVALVEELARRAALAGDNARLYAAAQALNVDLERRVEERTQALLAANAELEHSRQQLRNLSAGLQAAREAERARLAREVHDQLGAALTALKMDLAVMRRLDALNRAVALRERGNRMEALLDDTITLVRRIATDLRPGVLDNLGLSAAIDWQFTDFQARSGIAGTLINEVGEIVLDPDCATAIIRVFQETLTNIARHAGAHRVTVSLRRVDTHLVLEVADDGRGIAAHEISGTRSLGLLGMRERVRLLSGELVIQGRPAEGTRVTVRLPLDRLGPSAGAARPNP